MTASLHAHAPASTQAAAVSLTAAPDLVRVTETSPLWVSTPGRKAVSPDVAFAFDAGGL